MPELIYIVVELFIFRVNMVGAGWQAIDAIASVSYVDISLSGSDAVSCHY